jgi:uncharacterized protein (UPF0332 family)
MTHPKEELIKYRLQRAEAALEEAGVMADMHHWETCINRLYYACFYAVNALLLKFDLVSAKHTGVRSLFNSHFIATGKIEKHHGQLYNLLFKYRQQSDYEDLFKIEEHIVKEWLLQTKDFLKDIAAYIAIKNGRCP